MQLSIVNMTSSSRFTSTSPSTLSHLADNHHLFPHQPPSSASSLLSGSNNNSPLIIDSGDEKSVNGHQSNSPISNNSSSVSRKPFTIEEDARLIEIVKGMDPFTGWEVVAAHIKGRTARQCRERWIGYLSPGIRVEPWTESEDQMLLQQISRVGHKWTLIALHFNGRSGNDVKNRWYSHLKDISFQLPDGSYQISRDNDGSIISAKKKRRRKLVSAYDAAIDKLSEKQQQQQVSRAPVHLVTFPSNAMNFFNSELYLPPLLPAPR